MGTSAANMRDAQLEVATHYLEALIHRSISHWVFLPAILAMVLTFVLILIFYLTCFSERYRASIRTALVTSVVGLSLYLLGVGLSYVFLIDAADAANLGSFERYIGSGIIAMMVATLYLWAFAPDVLKINAHRVMMVVGTLIAAALLVASIPSIAQEIDTNLNTSTSATFRAGHAPLFSTVDFENDKVFIVLQDGYRWEFSAFMYYTYPLAINPPTNVPYLTSSPPRPDTPIYNIDGDAGTWARYLLDNGYDYVYLAYINDTFYEQYGALFYASGTIWSQALYAVEVDDYGNVILSMAAQPPYFYE